MRKKRIDGLLFLALVNGGLEGKIEVIQGPLDGKAGHLDLFLIGSFLFGSGLFRKDVVQNVCNVEILLFFGCPHRDWATPTPFSPLAPRGDE